MKGGSPALINGVERGTSNFLLGDLLTIMGVLLLVPVPCPSPLPQV